MRVRDGGGSKFVLSKKGGSCKKSFWNAPEEDRVGKQEVSASLANVKEISVDAIILAVLFKFDCIFRRQRNKNSTKGGQHVFVLLLTAFGKSLIKHRVVTCG